MMKPLFATIVFCHLIFTPKVLSAEVGTVEFLNSEATSGLPFSDAVRVGGLLFLSGNIGNIPGTMQLAQGGIQGEAKQTLINIKNTLESHGYAMTDVVKCTVMLADIAEWADFNEVYKEFFIPPYPARSAFATTGLALGARVEVECIAAARGK